MTSIHAHRSSSIGVIVRTPLDKSYEPRIRFEQSGILCIITLESVPEQPLISVIDADSLRRNA